jgi:hypothetical protein
MTSKPVLENAHPGPFGLHGKSTPVGEAVTVDRAFVERLIRLSLRGLEKMYHPEDQLLYSVDFENGSRETVRHLGKRYTVMSALGIYEARAAGYTTFLDGKDLLREGLRSFEGEDIDHLAMALWADCTIDSGLGDELISRLAAALDDGHEKHIGRVLAWGLTAIALHAERDPEGPTKALAETLFGFAKTQCWREKGGLFAHRGEGGPGFVRNMALFSTQIYWVYAFATFGRVFQNDEAIRIATRCADTLISLRDPCAGWPWRYDAARGRVTERYPVYSVHQDAMAPMALHALQDATGTSFAQVNQESMGWLYRNELGLPMVDDEEDVIFRAIRRRFPLNRMAYQTGWATAFCGLTSPMREKPWFLRLNATCRPYHLGWVLHAWCGREDRIGA